MPETRATWQSLKWLCSRMASGRYLEFLRYCRYRWW